MKILFSAFILTFITGCSSSNISKNTIIDDFYNEFPETTIVSVIATEGDFNNVYYEVQYRKKASDIVYKKELLYQRDISNNEWRLERNSE